MNNLNIIYEDNHIIVVEKKANILSQGDSTNDIDLHSIVKKYIKEKYNKPGNVYLALLHRLDRPVGGIMVFSKTSKSAARMSDMIKKHDVKKTYLAIINGILNKDGIFVDYLKREDNGNTVVSTEKCGKYAELSYKILDKNEKENKTLVKIQLKTGRHHQIRVQFASRNYPICGDQRYGNGDSGQIALFAYQLEFIHPIKKEKMKFTILPGKKDYWKYFDIEKLCK